MEFLTDIGNKIFFNVYDNSISFYIETEKKKIKITILKDDNVQVSIYDKFNQRLDLFDKFLSVQDFIDSGILRSIKYINRSRVA